MLLWLALAIPLTAQHNTYDHRINWRAEQGVLEVHTQIKVHHHYWDADTLFVHLPSRSLEWKNSHWHGQLLEFQKTQPYFASQEELGSLSIKNMELNGLKVSSCQNCEWLAVPIPTSLSRDSLVLTMNYTLHLPQGAFTPQGIKTEYSALIDWLPRVERYENGRWYNYPRDFFYSNYLPLDSFFIHLTLPAHYRVASNATLHTFVERRWYQSMATHGNATRDPWTGKAQKTLRFSATARHLQLFVSPYFTVHSAHGNWLYELDAKPWLPALMESIERKISTFFKRELNDSLNTYHTVLMLPDKKVDFHSKGMLTLAATDKVFNLERDLVLARAQAGLDGRVKPNGWLYPWQARGLPYSYMQWYVQRYFPDKNWLPYSNSLLGKLFDLDELDYSYENQLVYLFLARQGLDQSMGAPMDSLTRLNVKAIHEAKAFLALHHLRAYIGERDFRRGMSRYLHQNAGKSVTPKDLQEAWDYYTPKSIKWCFGDFINGKDYYDYQLVKIDYCPTIATATVRNLGHLAVPYSITGYKNGEKVLTEWHEGHLGKKTVQTYHAQYDKVVINEHQIQPEYRQNNNSLDYNRLLKRLEPLRLQPLNGFENPEKTEIYMLPSLDFNAYDKLLLGITFYNEALVNKNWEFTLAPFYSTGTGSVTGSGAVGFTQVLAKNSKLRMIKYGVFGRYFHFDEDLAFSRFSPTVRFFFRKPYPRSPLIRSLRLRLVTLNRELDDDFDGFANRFNTASFTVGEVTWERENTNVLKPTTFKTSMQFGDQFGKVQAMYDKRWTLPNRRWLIWRSFAGYMLYNDFLDRGIRNNFFSFGLSGTRDYLFDYGFFGRSDSNTIWAQQMFITDGGFKSGMNVFADEWMLSTNLSVPVWNMLGVFGDLGLADNFDNIYYDYGVRIAPISDFAEIYLPIGNNRGFAWDQGSYTSQIRFLIDIDIGNIRDRVRRGYY